MIIGNLSNRSTLNYATIARDLARLQLFTSDGKTHNVNKDFYVELVMSPRDISDKFRCDIAPRFGVTFDVEMNNATCTLIDGGKFVINCENLDRTQQSVIDEHFKHMLETFCSWSYTVKFNGSIKENIIGPAGNRNILSNISCSVTYTDILISSDTSEGFVNCTINDFNCTLNQTGAIDKVKDILRSIIKSENVKNLYPYFTMSVDVTFPDTSCGLCEGLTFFMCKDDENQGGNDASQLIELSRFYDVYQSSNTNSIPNRQYLYKAPFETEMYARFRKDEEFQFIDNIEERLVIDWSQDHKMTFPKYKHSTEDEVNIYDTNKSIRIKGWQGDPVRDLCNYADVFVIAFKPEVEGVFKSSVDFYIVFKNEEGRKEGYKWLTINCFGEAEDEDERFRTMFTNFGIPDPYSYHKVFYDVSPNQDGKDHNFLNKKSKELFLTYDQIFPYKGTYKALMNAVRFLGYHDVIFKEWYTIIDNDRETRDLLFDAVDFNNTGLPEDIFAKYGISKEDFIGYRKLNKLTMVYHMYDHEKKNDVDYASDGTRPKFNPGLNLRTNLTHENLGHFETIPEYFVYRYSKYDNDTMLSKLYMLKKWLERNILGANCHIVDVLGEGLVYETIDSHAYGNMHTMLGIDTTEMMTPYCIPESDLKTIPVKENIVTDLVVGLEEMKQGADGYPRGIKFKHLGHKKFSDLINYNDGTDENSEIRLQSAIPGAEDFSNIMKVRQPVPFKTLDFRAVMTTDSCSLVEYQTLDNEVNPILIKDNQIQLMNPTFYQGQIDYDGSYVGKGLDNEGLPHYDHTMCPVVRITSGQLYSFILNDELRKKIYCAFDDVDAVENLSYKTYRNNFTKEEKPSKELPVNCDYVINLTGRDHYCGDITVTIISGKTYYADYWSANIESGTAPEVNAHVWWDKSANQTDQWTGYKNNSAEKLEQKIINGTTWTHYRKKIYYEKKNNGDKLKGFLFYQLEQQANDSNNTNAQFYVTGCNIVEEGYYNNEYQNVFDMCERIVIGENTNVEHSRIIARPERITLVPAKPSQDGEAFNPVFHVSIDNDRNTHILHLENYKILEHVNTTLCENVVDLNDIPISSLHFEIYQGDIEFPRVSYQEGSRNVISSVRLDFDRDDNVKDYRDRGINTKISAEYTYYLDEIDLGANTGTWQWHLPVTRKGDYQIHALGTDTNGHVYTSSSKRTYNVSSEEPRISLITNISRPKFPTDFFTPENYDTEWGTPANENVIGEILADDDLNGTNIYDVFTFRASENDKSRHRFTEGSINSNYYNFIKWLQKVADVPHYLGSHIVPLNDVNDENQTITISDYCSYAHIPVPNDYVYFWSVTERCFKSGVVFDDSNQTSYFNGFPVSHSMLPFTTWIPRKSTNVYEYPIRKGSTETDTFHTSSIDFYTTYKKQLRFNDGVSSKDLFSNLIQLIDTAFGANEEYDYIFDHTYDSTNMNPMCDKPVKYNLTSIENLLKDEKHDDGKKIDILHALTYPSGECEFETSDNINPDLTLTYGKLHLISQEYTLSAPDKNNLTNYISIPTVYTESDLYLVITGLTSDKDNNNNIIVCKSEDNTSIDPITVTSTDTNKNNDIFNNYNKVIYYKIDAESNNKIYLWFNTTHMNTLKDVTVMWYYKGCGYKELMNMKYNNAFHLIEPENPKRNYLIESFDGCKMSKNSYREIPLLMSLIENESDDDIMIREIEEDGKFYTEFDTYTIDKDGSCHLTTKGDYQTLNKAGINTSNYKGCKCKVSYVFDENELYLFSATYVIESIKWHDNQFKLNPYSSDKKQSGVFQKCTIRVKGRVNFDVLKGLNNMTLREDLQFMPYVKISFFPSEMAGYIKGVIDGTPTTKSIKHSEWGTSTTFKIKNDDGANPIDFVDKRWFANICEYDILNLNLAMYHDYLDVIGQNYMFHYTDRPLAIHDNECVVVAASVRQKDKKGNIITDENGTLTSYIDVLGFSGRMDSLTTNPTTTQLGMLSYFNENVCHRTEWTWNVEEGDSLTYDDWNDEFHLINAEVYKKKRYQTWFKCANQALIVKPERYGLNQIVLDYYDKYGNHSHNNKSGVLYVTHYEDDTKLTTLKDKL